MKYGYARVSTVDQDLTVQQDALTAHGVNVIRSEKLSGTRQNTDRPELRLILDFIRRDDTLVVTRIDRLARSVSDLSTIVDELREKGANLVATEQHIDTSNASGRAFLQMLAVFAEFETSIRAERQREGIAKARAAGVYDGRKPVTAGNPREGTGISFAKVKAALESNGGSASAAARVLGVGRATVYRVIREREPDYFNPPGEAVAVAV